VIEYAGYYLGIGIINASLLFDIPSVVVSAQFDTSIMLEKAQTTIDENVNQFRNIGENKAISRTAARAGVRAGRLLDGH